MRRKRAALVTFFFLLVSLCVATGLWLRAQQRQYALNRQLIAALKQANDRWALVLVNAGADPNTRYEPTPVPSLPELIKQMFHRSSPSANNSDTAFTIALGMRLSWWEGDKKVIVQCPNNIDLVQAMIAHGAHINARMDREMTPLMLATMGGDADVKIVRCLIKNGADVKACDVDGETALHWMINDSETRADIVEILLAAGADPNLADTTGTTPLMEAKEYKHPKIIAILKHYGARK